MGPMGMLIAAAGIVYGDIGTSPLYTLKEVFRENQYGVSINHDGVFGVLSVVLWSFIWVVSIKYVCFVMRADNQGEGGIMALLVLARRATTSNRKLQALLVALGLFGAALFYGDSMITPAVSVLSAIEGITLVFPEIHHWIIPLALIILVGLFAIQRHGTSRIGKLFGPVMVLWFTVLGILGIYGICRYPSVLQALNPYWGVHFFVNHPGIGLSILSALVLALTGAEALYADMGHFGRKPIARAWFFLVLPGLILNYFGQGAELLNNPDAIRNPFFLLAPTWGLLPLIALATLSTVIASQAVISGAFSITSQAIQLGYLPRMKVSHTSSHEAGQIYISIINWSLAIAVVMLVIVFKSSGALAAAYGVAVTGTMLVTTILVSVVILNLWKWPLWLGVPCMLGFLLVDGLYFAANAPKILGGGAFPFIVAILIFIAVTTWKRGRQLLMSRLERGTIPLPLFIDSIRRAPPVRVKGTAVFLTAREDAVPQALLINLLHNQVLHEQIVLLTVVTEDSPRVSASQRLELNTFGDNFYRIILHYGFMEEPDIPKALAGCTFDHIDFSPMNTTYFLSRETIVGSDSRIGMSRWREALFAFELRNANSNMRYFKLPINRVIELGTQVEI